MSQSVGCGETHASLAWKSPSSSSSSESNTIVLLLLLEGFCAAFLAGEAFVLFVAAGWAGDLRLLAADAEPSLDA